ncbi:MAG: 6-phosphogluconolactonase [Gemmatimonadales bacterium]
MSEDDPRQAEDPLTVALDLARLGMGQDGHTASLFAGQATLHETARWVMAVCVPELTVWRITLTPALLNHARNVTFVVSGPSKAKNERRAD